MKTPISLSSIIESFTKVAEEEVIDPAAAQAAAAQAAAEEEAAAQAAAEDDAEGELENATAHAQKDEIKEALTDAAQAAAKAYDEHEQALELLKELALEAASADDAQIAKEAMLHGKVMAHTLIQEMDKVAMERNAYAATQEMLDARAQEDFDALTGITKSAFDLTNDYLYKVAAEDADDDENGEGDYEEDSADGIDTEVQDDDVEEIAKEAFDQAFDLTNDYMYKVAAEDTDEAGEGDYEEDSADGIDTEVQDDDVEEIEKDAAELMALCKQAYEEAFFATGSYLEKAAEDDEDDDDEDDEDDDDDDDDDDDVTKEAFDRAFQMTNDYFAR